MDSDRHARNRASDEAAGLKPRHGPGRQTPGQTKQRNVELLDTALDHFVERGFESASIEGIAAAARMAKRTVYLRYGDKTRLFKATLQYAIEQWIVPLDRLRAAETASVDETFLRIGRILVANIVSASGMRLMRITNAESVRMPEIGQFTYERGTAPTIAYLTDLIRRRIKPGGNEVADPEQVAKAFLSLVVGRPATLTAWGIALDTAAIDDETRFAVNLFLNGVMHAPASSGGRRPRGTDDRAAQPAAAPALLRSRHLDSCPAAAPALLRSRHSDRAEALEEENRRLKLLLAEYVLEVKTLKGGPRQG